MMSPSGYSETKVSDTQYQVQAAGTEATPKARIEKIARARAAQIGVEEKMKFYKVASVQYGVACQKAHEFYKGGTTSREAARQSCSTSSTPRSRRTRLSSAPRTATTALSGELASEEVPPEAKAAAEQEARAGCGQPT